MLDLIDAMDARYGTICVSSDSECDRLMQLRRVGWAALLLHHPGVPCGGPGRKNEYVVGKSNN